MSVWGISCGLEGGAPVVHAVEVTGPRSAISMKQIWRHRAAASKKKDWAQLLVDLAADLDTALRTAGRKNMPSAIVVRSIDWSRFQKNTTIQPRHQVDGVITVTARKHVKLVEALSGLQIGARCKSSKDKVVAEAKAVVGVALAEAGAAGIAALVLAGED
jgi:hypothetical protein